MIKINKHEEEALKRLRFIRKGYCPNIFISGQSVSSLERLGLKVIDRLEKQNVLDFNGMCKHFTIMMPYYDSKSEAVRFMDHLLNSISIARDCYDEFRGFILIEMSIEWSKYGINDSLDLFFNYVKRNDNLRFVLLLPEIRNRTDVDGFFSEFFRCGYCIKLESELVSCQQNVAYFCILANDMGYIISEDAQSYLYQRMMERDQIMGDNTELIIKLIQQIVFDKEYGISKNKEIDVVDIQKYLPEKHGVSKPKMGFVR